MTDPYSLFSPPPLKAKQVHIDKLFDELCSIQGDVGSSNADQFELKLQVDGLTFLKELAEAQMEASENEMHKHIDVFDQLWKRNHVFKIKEQVQTDCSAVYLVSLEYIIKLTPCYALLYIKLLKINANFL